MTAAQRRFADTWEEWGDLHPLTNRARQALLSLLRRLREECALAGDWEWFEVYDARIRQIVGDSAELPERFNGKGEYRRDK